MSRPTGPPTEMPTSLPATSRGDMSTAAQRRRWYLRTHADGDTHRGTLDREGVVRADCGTSFRPQWLAIRDIAFPGYPPDPAQICPACKLVPAPTPTPRT
jgi:hypothetical protein